MQSGQRRNSNESNGTQRSTAPAQTLVIPLGVSPAVLTETVWAMAHEGPDRIPSRVVVLTTVAGRARIEEDLFARGGWQQLEDHLRAEELLPRGQPIRFGRTSEAIRLIPSPDGRSDVEDIHSTEECAVMAEFFSETLRSFTENADTRLTVSIAGGRKTMGALLHASMTLLGRAGDRMTHVLVSEPWERLPGFLFPGCAGAFRHPDSGAPLHSRDARVTLAEVPFVPLRYLFEREIQRFSGSFTRLMDSLRERSTGLDPNLRLRLDGNPDKPRARVGERKLALSPMSFAFLLFFARRAADDEGPLAALSDLRLEDLRETAAPYREGRESRFGHWSHALFERSPETWEPKEEPRRIASDLRTKLRKAGFDPIQIDHLVPRRDRLETSLPPDFIEIVPPAAEAPGAASRPKP